MGDLEVEAKVEMSQVVHAGVYGSHCGKDLTNQANVLLYQTIPDAATNF